MEGRGRLRQFRQFRPFRAFRSLGVTACSLVVALGSTGCFSDGHTSTDGASDVDSIDGAAVVATTVPPTTAQRVFPVDERPTDTPLWVKANAEATVLIPDFMEFAIMDKREYPLRSAAVFVEADGTAAAEVEVRNGDRFELDGWTFEMLDVGSDQIEFIYWPPPRESPRSRSRSSSRFPAGDELSLVWWTSAGLRI